MVIIKNSWPAVYSWLYPYRKIIKYLIAGGTAASTNLVGLYLLTDFGHFHYLISAIISFAIAFWVSFFLQKFWTFGDKTREKITEQALTYFLVALISLGANTLMLYVLVEYLGVWYLLGQVIAGAIIAVSNFFIYQLVIFKKPFQYEIVDYHSKS